MSRENNKEKRVKLNRSKMIKRNIRRIRRKRKTRIGQVLVRTGCQPRAMISNLMPLEELSSKLRLIHLSSELLQ